MSTKKEYIVSKATFNSIKKDIKEGTSKKLIRKAHMDLSNGLFNRVYEKASSQVNAKIFQELQEQGHVATSVRRFNSGTVGLYSKPSVNLKTVNVK